MTKLYNLWPNMVNVIQSYSHIWTYICINCPVEFVRFFMASAKHLTWQLERGGGGVQDVLDGGVHLGRDGVQNCV